MSWTKRVINAVRRTDRPRRPPEGRLVQPRAEDVWRDYPSSGLTPSRLMSILREADLGSLSAAMQLFEDMEEKDPHLYAVASTRRLALTGLDWSVVSAAEVGDSVEVSAADEAAVYAREALGAVETFDETLQHLSLALGRNLAVAELVWEAIGGELQLVDLVPVDFTRLVFDDLGAIRILTKAEPFDGIGLVPNKFIVHTPQSPGGHASRGGLLRVTAMAYLAKNLAIKDWMMFDEVFGMHVSIAR